MATTEDNLSHPWTSTISMLFCLSSMAIFGRIRDIIFYFLHPLAQKGTKGYAAIRDSAGDFYLRRMYGRIVDCWNRPISSAPDAWMDVMLRSRTRPSTAVDVASLVLSGETRKCLNLSSYNYLGFAASDPYCTPRVVESIQHYGVSGCSPCVHAGTTELHAELEATVAAFLGTEAALVYGMGFATNASTLPALVGPGCLVVSDALNHTSIVNGARASGAKIKVFRHNDVEHLDALLRDSIARGQPRSGRPWKKVLVVVEGVYSMEGEMPALAEIVRVAKAHRAYLYLDEAHSIGAMGATGRGCCEATGVDPRQVDVLMGTFTKSFGSCGGYIAGSRDLIDHLKTYSPAHITACAMAPGCVQQALSAFHVLMGLDGTGRGAAKVTQLHDNANYVRSRLLEMGFEVLGSWDSPVIPIMTYNVSQMVALSRALLARHVALVVVGYPATPLLLTRARLCISAAHTRQDLDWALGHLEEVADMVGIRFGNRRLYDALEEQLIQHVAARYGSEVAAAASVAALAAGWTPDAAAKGGSGTASARRGAAARAHGGAMDSASPRDQTVAVEAVARMAVSRVAVGVEARAGGRGKKSGKGAAARLAVEEAGGAAADHEVLVAVVGAAAGAAGRKGASVKAKAPAASVVSL